MANLKFNIISKQNPANLNVRFYHGKQIDCNAKSNILINQKLWSNKMQSLKPSVDKNLKNIYLEKIEKLKNLIVLSFNNDFSNGVIINSKWLDSIIKESYLRPSNKPDYEIYLCEYINKYIEDSKTRLNSKNGKTISIKTRTRYNNTLNKIIDYQKFTKERIKLTDVNLSFHKEYTSYLKVTHKYSNNFIQKNISQLKTFIREAKSEGFETNPDIENKKFTFAKDEIIDTYLNEEEITSVFELDFCENLRLDNVRDLFIIGLRTGLRISDLKRISEFHFSSNTILITGTEKTDNIVEIPIHPNVRSILKKRNGVLPNIISDQKFNKYIKEVCQEAGFSQKILGKLKNPKTNRKEKGFYEKYKLISSHTCRRSFATNLYGKISDKTIMAITTHKSHSQFLAYVKTTQKEHVNKLAEFWKNN